MSLAGRPTWGPARLHPSAASLQYQKKGRPGCVVTGDTSMAIRGHFPHINQNFLIL